MNPEEKRIIQKYFPNISSSDYQRLSFVQQEKNPVRTEEFPTSKFEIPIVEKLLYYLRLLKAELGGYRCEVCMKDTKGISYLNLDDGKKVCKECSIKPTKKLVEQYENSKKEFVMK